MNESHSHSIQKHTFDIRYSSRSKAWELQEKFTRFIRDHLLAIVDQTFTEESSQNAIVRINRLQLDLGEVRAQHFENDILEKFKNKKNPDSTIPMLLEYDKELKNSNINPGTCADLTAASLLFYKLSA